MQLVRSGLGFCDQNWAEGWARLSRCWALLRCWIQSSLLRVFCAWKDPSWGDADAHELLLDYYSDFTKLQYLGVLRRWRHHGELCADARSSSRLAVLWGSHRCLEYHYSLWATATTMQRAVSSGEEVSVGLIMSIVLIKYLYIHQIYMIIYR